MAPLFAILLILQALVLPVSQTLPIAHAEIGEQRTLGTVVDEWTKTIAPGATETSWMLDGAIGPQRAFMLDVDTDNPEIHLQAGMPDVDKFGMQTVRQQASAISEPGHVVIGGVNGDFYNMANGVPIGVVIQEGRVLKGGTREAFGIKANGEGIIGYPDASFSLITSTAEWDVNGVNQPRGGDDLIAYTAAKQSTGTDDSGAEVVVTGITDDILHIGQVSGEVTEVLHNSGNQPISEGQIILSGSGKAAEQLQSLQPGDQVTFSTTVAPGWDDVTQALGGQYILVKDGAPTSLQENSFTTAKAPRTAVGIRENGDIFVIVVDGRQPGSAEGITVFELRDLMLELGAVDSLNLDGGGSSTFVSREPGESGLSVKNNPSDGYERSVANSFFIISTAEVGNLSQLAVQPDNSLMLAGSTQSFTAKGMDAAHNPVALDPAPSWSVSDSAVGTINAEGQLTAGSTIAAGEIRAAVNGAAGTAAISVTDTITDLKLAQKALTVKRGEEVSLQATALLNGRTVHAGPDSFEWTVTGDIGSVNGNGVFTAADTTGSGTITVSYGDVSDTMDIQVGKMPVILETFEDGLDHWTSSGARYNSVSIRQTTYPEPARFGNHALELNYDFIGTIGTSGAYAHTKEDIEIEGYPEKIGMWVYGDGAGHWLRAQIRDGGNNAFALDFASEMDWTGWKYVEAAVPAGKETPLKLDLAVRLMETKNDNKNAGTIYVDNIRAVYGETDDDLISPELSQELPANNEVVGTNEIKFSVNAKDNEGGTGINPDRIFMEIDGQNVQHEFNEETGEVSYVPDETLLDGYHQAKVTVQDRFGNEQEKAWEFEISSGNAGIKPVFGESAYVGNPYTVGIHASGLDQIDRIRLQFQFDSEQLDAADTLVLNKAIPAEHVVKNDIGEDGRIELELKEVATIPGIREVEELATIPFETPVDAKDALTVEFVNGDVQLPGEGSPIPVFMPDVRANVAAHLTMEIDRTSKGFESKIKVMDQSGQPVKDAAVHVVSPDRQLTKITAKTAAVYQEPDASTAVITELAKHDHAVILEEQDGWLQVETGGQTGWIEAGQVKIEPWLLGTTDGEGGFKTDKFSINPGELVIQASRNEQYSYRTHINVLEHLESHKPERTNLTFTGNTNAMNVTWTTSPTTTMSVVEWIPTEQFNQHEFTGNQVKRTKGKSEPHAFEAGEIQVHSAMLRGLKTGETYTYRVGDGSEEGWSETGQFTAAPKCEDAFNFILMGDTQAPPNQTESGFGIFTELFKKANAEYSDAAFMMHVGDMIDDGNLYSHWNAFFESMKDPSLAASTPIVPTVGNHENIGNGVETYKQLFKMPQNGPDAFKGTVYSFDYGNAHFAVLNTETTKEGLEQQAKWLKADMETSKKKWKIAVFHRAPYYSNPQGGSENVREVFTKAMDEADIDMAISGHDHAYVRTIPLKGGVEADDGTTYLIAGSTGSKFYPTTPQSYMDKFFDEKTQIYTNIAVDDTGIRILAKTLDGQIVDEFTVTK